MADILLSPGVAAREFDKSQLTKRPIQFGAAIIGPTVKGQVEIPKLVTSYSEYLANFGSTFEFNSNTFTYFTSITAYNYFQNGGKSLLVTRVANGAFSEATSSRIQSGEALTTASLSGSQGFNVTAVSASSTQTLGTMASFAINGVTMFLTGSNTATDIVGKNTSTAVYVSVHPATTATNTAAFIVPAINNSQSVVGLNGISASQNGAILQLFATLTGSYGGFAGNQAYLTSGTETLWFKGGSNTEAFRLETIGQGELMNSDNGNYFTQSMGAIVSVSSTGSKNTLVSGSNDNIRWEVVNPDKAKGIFSVIIRRGNDKLKEKQILETFTNLSLDPKAPNYIERIIGNQKQDKRGSGTDIYLQTSGSYKNASEYVRVKKVYKKTPDYLDGAGVAKTKFTSSIPIAASGAFGGATGKLFTGTPKYYNDITNSNIQGLVGTDYTDAINLLANKDDFKYNLITTPGLVKSETDHSTQINTLLSNTKERGDAMAIIDPVLYSSTITSAVTQAESVDSSYAAMYWPWLQISDPDTGQLVWVPASVMVPGVYAYTDKIGFPWLAPAGKLRGKLGSVIQPERKLTNANRDTLYVGKVNPIATFPNAGVVVFGQKTLQTKATALDRVNVRRLLIALKSFISQIADTLVFDQNTISTRKKFLTQVNPYMEYVKSKQGLFAYKVVMDNSNNTSDVIDRNQLVGQIFVQPTRTAEFIYLDFTILPTGAQFPE